MLVQLDFRPDARQLRQFGFIALAAFGLVGAWASWKGTLFGIGLGDSARSVTLGLWALGAWCALLSVVWPQGNRPLFVALSLLAFPIGFLVSHMVLAVLFFGVLTPVGLVMRMLGHDPLERRFQKDRASYWVDMPQEIARRDYFRQF
jgi:Saxitoxin biosynthesis operon protein SxtJ